MNKHTRSVSLIDGHIEEMTEAEVKKALECLKGVEVECIGCAYQKCGYPMCREEVALDALDLINHQQEQIKKLESIERKLEMEEDKKIRDILKTDVLFIPTQTPICCRKCGTRLKVYYAEEKVCAVKCGYCEYIGIVKASNPMQAAFYFGEEKTEKGGAE